MKRGNENRREIIIISTKNIGRGGVGRECVTIILRKIKYGKNLVFFPSNLTLNQKLICFI